MIEIRNLYKRYHNHHGSDWVLKDINLTIPKGVSVGLIGANGAGKSTLLRLIAGMDTPEKGEVIRRSRVSWPVGLSGGMQGNMTGRQNVKFVARVQGGRGADIKKIIDFVEDFAEIGEAFDEPIRTYSSGMKSRLSFGLSLAFDFDVYISDEATAVGDRSFKAKAQKLFKDKVGKSSLIMVSHGEGILRDLCQVGVYIKNGQAFWYDDINDAITDYHNDVDAKKENASVAPALEKPAVSFRDTDPANFNKAQLQAAQKKLNAAQLQVEGIGARVRQAKKENWPEEEVVTLSSLHKDALKQVNILKRVVNGTPQVSRINAKKEISDARNSVKSLTLLIKKADQKKWPDERKAVIKKALKAAQKQKERAEAKLEAIDGLD